MLQAIKPSTTFSSIKEPKTRIERLIEAHIPLRDAYLAYGHADDELIDAESAFWESNAAIMSPADAILLIDHVLANPDAFFTFMGHEDCIECRENFLRDLRNAFAQVVA